jgi:ssDNA-binding Zn-finger/Zn-ribbon topoisomerase 1
MQGYCVKCKTNREMKDMTLTTASNGRTMAKGTCPTCGTKMNKFLSKAEADSLKK